MKLGEKEFVRLDAAAVLDAAGRAFAPGSLLIEVEHRMQWQGWPVARMTVLASGTPAQIAKHPIGLAARLETLPRSVVVPGFVNAHTHLDLTHIGPRPYEPSRGFGGFVDVVRTHRRADEAGIAESVLRGAVLSLRGGVVAVGDIGGAVLGRASGAAWSALRETPLWGVGFVEFFAIGRGEAPALAHLRTLLEALPRECEGKLRLGLQPHAPTTVSLAGYAEAIRLAGSDLPLATHLAETPEEREFIASGAGPHREFLERLGLWDGALLGEIGQGRTPVAHLSAMLARAPFLAVHVNQASDEDLSVLPRGTTVAYCPRASEYFRASSHFGPHRYAQMPRVVLGTDSIINLPSGADDPSRGRISPLDEARRLYRRDGGSPQRFLGMLTVDAAPALRLEREAFTFAEGSVLAGLNVIELPSSLPTAGLNAAHALRHCFETDAPPRLLFIGAGAAP